MSNHSRLAKRSWLETATVCWLQGTLLVTLMSGCAGRGSAPSPLNRDEAAKVVWTFEQVERGAIVSSPLVAGDRVYVGAIRDAGLSTSGAVYCLDRKTGKELWKFDDDGDMQHMYSSPCLADGKIYIGEGMHANHVCKLYCLDARCGREEWHFVTAGHIESSPCVANGKVFFGSGDDGVYCLDAATGEQLWHFHGPFHVDSNPVVLGKRLYAGSGVSRTCKRTEIFCLDTEDGRVVWREGTDLPVWGSPVVDGDQVFFGLGNGRLVSSAAPPEKPAGAVLCVDAKTGRQRWRHDVSDAVHVKPAVDHKQVYFGARDGYCYCVERGEGRLLWKENLGSPVVANPALVDGHVYVVGSEGRVSRLDTESGKTSWTFEVAQFSQTKPRMFSSPAVVSETANGGAHHRIYVGAELQNPVSSAAVLYCLRD